MSPERINPQKLSGAEANPSKRGFVFDELEGKVGRAWAVDPEYYQVDPPPEIESWVAEISEPDGSYSYLLIELAQYVEMSYMDNEPVLEESSHRIQIQYIEPSPEEDDFDVAVGDCSFANGRRFFEREFKVIDRGLAHKLVEEVVRQCVEGEIYPWDPSFSSQIERVVPGKTIKLERPTKFIPRKTPKPD